MASGVWSPIAGATSPTLTLAAAHVADSGHHFRVKISRDAQVTISTEVSLTVTSAVIAPSITVQPKSIQVTQGADASFALTATGTSLAFRWQTSNDGINWVDAVGGTNVAFTLKSVGLDANNLRLRALVSNTKGTVTSDTAILTVASAQSAPTFVTQPASVAVTAPATATFSVSISGTPQPTLQWQKSVDSGATYANISGATSASYTTPATSESQSGYRFRLVASNSVSTATSNAATLTVSAASTAPLVTTQPLAVSTAAGATASFTVGFSGVPTPTVQWQLSTNGGSTFSNVNGATSSTYGHLAAANESGWLYRAVVSNSQGSVTSQNAKLTVLSASSVLQGKAWTTAVPVESGSELVLGTFSAQAIDEKGNVMVLFAKASGGRLALHAVKGVAGSAGSAPVFGTPVVLDSDAPFNQVDAAPTLAVSPNGNAVVGWSHRAPCTSATYNDSTSATCKYWYSTRYKAAQGTWEPPVLVGDMYIPGMTASINDAGDVAALYGITTSPGSLIQSLAVGWRGAGQSGFTRQSWPVDVNGTFIPRTVTLDSASRLVVFGTVNQASSQNLDIAVYRGTISGGLGTAREVIDLRGATATYMQALGNPTGQQIVLWSQNNGTKDTVYAATLDSPAGTWTVTDTGESKPADGTSKATLAPSGNFIWYFWNSCASKRRIGGVWSIKSSLPSTMCNATGVLGKPVISPNGNVWSLLSNSEWLSYDAMANEVIAAIPKATTTGSGYLLGFYQSMATLPGELLLSDSGIGAYVSVNGYSVIPTSALPAGDGTGIYNVWAWYLK